MNLRTLRQTVYKTLLLLLFQAFFVAGVYAQSEGFLDKKDHQRFKKRQIHPKSKYFAVSAGIGFTVTNVQDPNGFLSEGPVMENNTYLPSFMYEHGLTRNFFAEIGYAYIGMGVTHKRVVAKVSSSSYSGHFSNHDVQIGAGYRLINQSSYHFFNIHAGLFVGIPNEVLQDLPISFTSLANDPATGKDYSITLSILDFRPFSFGPYLGISKELRITSDLRFFIKYVQRFGIISTMSGTFELQSDEIAFDSDMARFQVRGSGAFITGGLKILLNRKALQHLPVR